MATTPSQQDFVKGIDLSAQTQVSGTQLDQLIDAGYPADDKGLVMQTTDIATVPQVPDANTYPKWRQYLWERISASSVAIYLWNPNAASDPTLLKWQPITLTSLPDNAVTTSKIADGAVTNSKIASVDYSKITNAPAGLPPTGVAGGNLTGTYPNPTIGVGQVTGTQIANATIVTGNITLGNLIVSGASSVIAPSASGYQILRTKSDRSVTEWVTDVFSQSTAGGTRGSKYQVPVVSAAGTDIVWDTQAILQSVQSANLGAVGGSTTANVPPVTSATPPSNTNGDSYGVQSITSKANNKFRIRATLHVASSITTFPVVAFVCLQGSGNALAAAAATPSVANTTLAPIVLDFIYAPGGAVPATFTFDLRVGLTSAGTFYINRPSAGVPYGGGIIDTTINIQEVT